MPQNRIHPHWENRVGDLVENGPKLSNQKMADLFVEEKKGLALADFPTITGYSPVTDAPSEAWVRKQVAKHPADEAGRSRYRYVQWPESFVDGWLPWEASGIILELLRHYRSQNYPTNRPTVKMALWFWRVTLAEPQIEEELRRRLAARCVVIDGRTDTAAVDMRRDVERLLIEQKWVAGSTQTPPNRDDFVEAVKELVGPATYEAQLTAVMENERSRAPRVVVRGRRRQDTVGSAPVAAASDGQEGEA